MSLVGAGSCVVLLVSLLLEGCDHPLGCTSTAVVERLQVKLDREMREDPRFLALHDPDLSSFGVSGIRQEGVSDGALACSAAFVAIMDAGPSFAKDHGFAATSKRFAIERTVRFTAHRGRWDTYVEVVSLDPPPNSSATATTRVSAP